MIVVQTAFNAIMTAIGVLCAIIVALFVFYAYTAPETLETAIPQIHEMVATTVQNAQALIKNLINEIN